MWRDKVLGSRDDFCISEELVTILNNLNDPRLAMFADPAPGNTEFLVGDIVKYQSSDHSRIHHNGPLKGLTDFAEYQIASVNNNSITLVGGYRNYHTT